MADDMAGMEEQKQKEGINYQKAANFLNSADIKQDMPAKDLIKICGEPVAKADDGLRWVYKSPTSTFFKGEKIYFYLDKDQKLVSWEKVYQK